MFRKDDKVIVPEPTPERVYQCALYLRDHDQGITRDDFRNAMAMPEIFADKGEKIFDIVFPVFSELDLCTELDNKLYPSENLKGIKDVHDFRRYCARVIFQERESLFSKVTSMYCEYAEDLMKVGKWAEVNLFMGKKGLEFHDNVLKGWRLWAPFLGCGYLNDYFMIPNWGRRIADLLEEQDVFPLNENIPLEKFMGWLVKKAPEIQASIRGRQIGLGVSNGLHTLDDLDILKTVYVPDADQWQWVSSGGSSTISHVRIVG